MLHLVTAYHRGGTTALSIVTVLFKKDLISTTDTQTFLNIAHIIPHVIELRQKPKWDVGCPPVQKARPPSLKNTTASLFRSHRTKWLDSMVTGDDEKGAFYSNFIEWADYRSCDRKRTLSNPTNTGVLHFPCILRPMCNVCPNCRNKNSLKMPITILYCLTKNSRCSKTHINYNVVYFLNHSHRRFDCLLKLSTIIID